MPIITPGSSYDKMKDDRTRVNNLTNFGTQPTSDFPRCRVCLEQPRLEVFTSDNGKRMGKCVRGCGQTFELEPANVPSTDTNSKYESRYGSTSKQNFFIISQTKKKKTAEELQREQIAKELSTDGVTVVDSRESTYSEGGGWTS